MVAQSVGCGGSMVVRQAEKPAVRGSNPASLQPAGTCHSLLGSQQGWQDNCRLASEGRAEAKNTTIPKNNKKNKKMYVYGRRNVMQSLAISSYNEVSQ